MSALLMFFWLQLGRPHSNDANSDHGAGFFQSHLQSVFFTSATLRLRDLRADDATAVSSLARQLCEAWNAVAL